MAQQGSIIDDPQASPWMNDPVISDPAQAAPWMNDPVIETAPVNPVAPAPKQPEFSNSVDQVHDNWLHMKAAREAGIYGGKTRNTILRQRERESQEKFPEIKFSPARYERMLRLYKDAKDVVAEWNQKGEMAGDDKILAIPKEDREMFLGIVANVSRKDLLKDEGFLGKLQQRFASGVGGIAQNVERGIAKALPGSGADRTLEGLEWLHNVKGTILQEGNPAKGGTVTEPLLAAAQMAPPMIASTLIPVGGAGAATQFATQTAFWTTQIAPDLEKSLVQSGLDRRWATPIAAVTAIAEGVVENYNPRQLLGIKATMGEGGLRSYIFESLKGYLKEYSEEAQQAALEIAARKVANMVDPNVKFDAKEEAKAFYEQMQQTGLPLAVLMAPGAISGGMRHLETIRAKGPVSRKDGKSLGLTEAEMETQETRTKAVDDRITQLQESQNESQVQKEVPIEETQVPTTPAATKEAEVPVVPEVTPAQEEQVPVAEAKEPWQMKLGEFVPEDKMDDEAIFKEHRKSVMDAINRGDIESHPDYPETVRAAELKKAENPADILDSMSKQRSVTGSDIGRLLAAQKNNVDARAEGVAGRDAESLAGKWLASDEFVLMDIPVDIARPATAEEGEPSVTPDAPIVVDKNTTGSGRLHGKFGAPADVLIVDGKHRQAEAKRAGKTTIKAWVGKEAVPFIERATASPDPFFDPLSDEEVTAFGKRFKVQGATREEVISELKKKPKVVALMQEEEADSAMAEEADMDAVRPLSETDVQMRKAIEEQDRLDAIEAEREKAEKRLNEEERNLSRARDSEQKRLGKRRGSAMVPPAITAELQGKSETKIEKIDNRIAEIKAERRALYNPEPVKAPVVETPVVAPPKVGRKKAPKKVEAAAPVAKEPFEMTREEYFNNPERVQADVQETEGWKVSYKYTTPGSGGPFTGSIVLSEKPKKGDIVSGMMGKAKVTSVSKAKPRKMDNQELRDKGKAAHRRSVEEAVKAGKTVPAEVLADYPELQTKTGPAKLYSGDQVRFRNSGGAEFTGEVTKVWPDGKVDVIAHGAKASVGLNADQILEVTKPGKKAEQAELAAKRESEDKARGVVATPNPAVAKLQQDLEAAAPGSKVETLENGVRVTLPGGAVVDGLFTPPIDANAAKAAKDYGTTETQMKKRLKTSRVAGATVKPGTVVRFKDGTTRTFDQVTMLYDPAVADKSTAFHEMHHVAKDIGFYATKIGKRIYKSLIKRFGSDEGIATAREVWVGPKGLAAKVRAFVQSILDPLRRALKKGMNPELAMAKTFGKKFWSQAGKQAEGGAQYQLKAVPFESVDEANAARKALLDAINSGGTTSADIDNYVARVQKMPMETRRKVYYDAFIYSMAGAAKNLRAALLNQLDMGVKSRGMREQSKPTAQPWKDDASQAASQAVDMASEITLPDLLKTLQAKFPDLTVEEFRKGMLELRDSGQVTLMPYTRAPAEVADQPGVIFEPKGKRSIYDETLYMVRAGNQPSYQLKPGQSKADAMRELLEQLAQEEEAAAAEKESAKARPDLANPATDQAARDLVDKVDRQRNAAGKPVKKADEVVYEEASSRLKEGYDKEHSELIRKGREGEQLNDVETVMAKQILNKEAMDAIKSGTQSSITKAMSLLESYRNTGTEQARAFRLRMDPVETPAERYTRLVSEAILEPPRKDRERRNKARREGNNDLADKINAKWAKEMAVLKEKLKKHGIDLDHLGEPVKKDKPTPVTKSNKVVRQERAKKSLENFHNIFKRKVTTSSTGVDPELLVAAVEVVRAYVDLGVGNFVDFVKGVKADGLVEDWDSVKPVFEAAWEQENPKEGLTKTKAVKVLRAVQHAKAGTFDKMYEYWISSILSAPTTQAANIIGNVGNAAWSLTAERLIEATVNLGMRRSEGARFGEFKYMFAGILPGISRGARNFLVSWETESPTLEDQIGRASSQKVEEKESAIGGKTGRVVRVPLRLLGSVDDFCKSLVTQMEVGARAYRIAKSEGLSGEAMQARISELSANYESPAWDAAYDSALELAFQQPGGETAKKIKQYTLGARSNVPFLRYLIPFVTTPVNIFGSGISKSPLGTIGAGVKIYQNVQNGRHALEGLAPRVAQQIIAWALVAALLGNDDDDPWITGAESNLKLADKEVGYRAIPPLSIKIGGKYHSYSRLEPFATTLGLTIDFVNSLRSGDEDRITQVPFNSFIGQMGSKTFLSGIGSLVEAADSDSPAAGLTKWASTFATSWVPNVARSVARESEGEYMNRRYWGNGREWLARVGKRTLQKTELTTIQDFPLYDVWGRPAQRSVSPAGSDWLYRVLIPIKNQSTDIFVADRLLLNWNNANPDKATFPRSPQPYYERGGKTKYMSDKQYADFSRLAGEASAKAMTGKQFVDLNPDNPRSGDIMWIKDVVSETRSNVLDELIAQWEKGTPEVSIDVEKVAKRSSADVKKRWMSSNPPSRKSGETTQAFKDRLDTWKQLRKSRRDVLAK